MSSASTPNSELFPIFVSKVRDVGRVAAEQKFRVALETSVGKQVIDEVVAEYDALASTAKDGFPPTIVALPNTPWYSDQGSEGDRHWPALKAFLAAEKDWPESRIKDLHSASTKVVSHTTDPGDAKYACKGLVVGHVQSGKTANYTAVIAKLVDHSYNLVIVLSGIHNGLRSQTQGRLDAELHRLNPYLWKPTTDVDRDFIKPTRPMASDIVPPGHRTAVLCVVKKHKAPLGKLRNWIRQAERDGTISSVKALVIDDEADQASVETATINPLIRDILEVLPRHCYIGYTATPFANVLINPAVTDDLYPRNFILSLPRPEGYMGAEAIFGRDRVESDLVDDYEEPSGGDPVPLDGWDMVRIIPESEAETFRYSRSVPFAPAMSKNLRAATLYFWLATAARRIRGDHGHSTMLVHASLQTTSHAKLKHVFGTFHDYTKERLASQDPTFMAELEELWDSERLKANRPSKGYLVPDFDQLVPVLADIVEATDLIVDNSGSTERLDYENRPLDDAGEPEPLVVIAIGGNTLSRGLTLEGLTVSFFVRAAKAYDTLLQMGRWFGFRPGYEDLPRLWMTDELRRWFRHLAVVEHEIRGDIERYQTTVSTPVDFGVRIRCHPALTVTRKLGAAVPASTSYGGQRIQSRYFRLDEDWLVNNNAAANRLIADLVSNPIVTEAAIGNSGDSSGPVLFRNADVNHILRFLDTYQSHEDSPDLDRRLLTDYIRKLSESDDPSLEMWNVAVMAGNSRDEGVMRLGGSEFNLIRRSKLKDSQHSTTADIKTLMSKEHLVIDVDIDSASARRESEAWLKSLRDEAYPDTGLLLLYPIQAESRPDPSNEETRRNLAAPTDLVGLAMVFPDSRSNDAVNNDYIEVDLSAIQHEDTDPAAIGEEVG